VFDVAAPPPPLAWYGSSFAYYEPDPPPPPADELNAAADEARSRRLERFTPEQFQPRPGGGDSTGVVLGRFLPVHDGHRYLIEYARAYAGRVSVFVRVSDGDPIPWPVRRDWLSDLFPDVSVVPIEDQRTSDTAPTWREISQRWTDQIRAHVSPDYVFAGEDYGLSLAHLLKARYIRVDRGAVRVSGTQVRADPWAYEKYLPPGVRAWYVRRVCLIGPESSGKSRLARALAGHYGTVQVAEFARTLYRDPTLEWGPEYVSQIAQGQVTSQAVLARHASRVLFCDTNLLAVRLWSERLFDAAPDWVRAASEDDDIDLYLLTAPDLPFTGSARLNRPAEREDFHARCERELVRLGRPYVPIAGDDAQRFARAVEAVDALLAQPRP
jgi:HTH-type transcriptional regulator, transcriptional repressor of NAD biosynthesis genes